MDRGLSYLLSSKIVLISHYRNANVQLIDHVIESNWEKSFEGEYFHDSIK